MLIVYFFYLKPLRPKRHEHVISHNIDTQYNKGEL